MDYLIQELDNVINVIETTDGKYLFTATKMGNAQVVSEGSGVDSLVIYDGIGSADMTLNIVANTVSTQDNGGAVIPFTGTITQLADKLNNEYFDNATTTVIAPQPTASKLDTFSGSLIDLENPSSGTYTGFAFEIDAITIDGLNFQVIYEGVTSEVTNTQDLVDLLNSTQRAFTFTVIDDSRYVGVWGNERPVNDFTLLTISDSSNVEILEYTKNLVTATTSPNTQQEQIRLQELNKHLNLIDNRATIPKRSTFTPTGATISTLLGSNKYRKELIILNNTNKELYVNYGNTASATDRTLNVLANDDVAIIDSYKGNVTIAVSDTTGITGNVLITETE